MSLMVGVSLPCPACGATFGLRVVRQGGTPTRASTTVPRPADVPSGPELAQRRRALGVSQHALANAAYLSRGVVADAEGGRRTNPDLRLRIHQTLTAMEQAA